MTKLDALKRETFARGAPSPTKPSRAGDRRRFGAIVAPALLQEAGEVAAGDVRLGAIFAARHGAIVQLWQSVEWHARIEVMLPDDN